MAADALLHYKDFLIILGTAGLVIPLLMRVGINSILGFLIVGLVLGPHVLGQVAQHWPALASLATADLNSASGLAELGVVFLLFLIGLELSPERLRTMRRLVFGFGGLQVLLSLAGIAGLALAWGFSPAEAIVIGMALSLSSTAIVVQLLSSERRLGSQAGRISFAVLLLQDLAVVPMLLLVGAGSTPGGLLATISTTLLQVVAGGLAIVLVGRFALTPLLRLVAATHTADLFTAAVLFIAVGTGAMASLAGLSMSLGAFMAGLMLAETEYRRAIEAILEPFKGLLLGLFFLIVGFRLDVPLLLQQPLLILGAVLALICLKAVIILALGLLFRLPRASTLEAALLLGPGGEFAFVIIAAAATAGLFANGADKPILLVVTLSMMAIPLCARLARRLRGVVATPATVPAAAMEAPPSGQPVQVIVAGFGRVGSLIASMLEEQSIPYIAVDQDVKAVTEARKTNRNVYYGDATHVEFLRTCGIGTAKAMAITMDNPSRVDEILQVARAERPDIKIIARARDERHAQRLYASGVTEAVPETIEASLQLGEALLVESGIPMGLAIAAVHERRDGFRKLLGTPNRRAQVAQARKRLRDSMKG